MQDRVVIQAEAVHKSFGATRALAGVSIALRAGAIHGLVGENGAGKSTLINILSGVFPPDAGSLSLDGAPVSFHAPRQALEAGIGSVHQELAICPHVTVSENIFMGHGDKVGWGPVDFRRIHREAATLLQTFHAGIDPRQKAGALSIAQQQVVEIVKALSCNCKVLILDEPTSSLTSTEAETLFALVRRLRSSGIAILYVSHRMSEIFSLCDRVTILRDGHLIDTLDVSELDRQTVINKMVGRTLTDMYPPKRGTAGEIILEVRGLTRKGRYRDVSFALHKGEILGFSGLVGAGRTELARGVCGIDRIDSGEVWLGGKRLPVRSFRDAIDQGLVYLPEDRKLGGLFLGLNIQANISAASLRQVMRGIFINRSAEKKRAASFARTLNIKHRSLAQLLRELSGGNQQKAMVAKWLATKPRVIIMDEPTRGIDVGAKAEIYVLVDTLVKEGIGIIIISSELPEIIGMCDRVIVMYEGACRGIVEGARIEEPAIMTLASGHA
jgi:ribose transport system ATP-binding protein